jgi:hypothetical protein
MKRPLPKIRYVAILILAVTLFGFARMLPVPAAHSMEPAAPSLSVAQAAATASSTATRGPIEATLTPTALVPFPTESSNATLFAFIEAPQGAVAQPYVTITAFQAGTFSTSVTILGTINTTEFICSGSPCTIPIQLGESRFIFRAQTPTGLIGETVFATAVAEQRPDGYHVTIVSVSQFARAFEDACLKSWDITVETQPTWAEFPQYPYELNTQIPLHHLAARLISYGVVDTRDCPAGGLSQDMDWPNACGLERANAQMIVWQNQFDEAIWTAANDVGIPPKIIKTLIEVESQFWPGNERFYVDEYGLGQLNQLGVDVLLRTNFDLYQKVCPSVLTNCNSPYLSLPAQQQAQVRGALMASMNATCTTCTYGIDLTKAKQSIDLVSQVLRANCDQAKSVVELRSAPTDYESYWRFTLLSYHSGAACLAEAIKNTKLVGDPTDWEHVAPQINCPGGRKYVDNFWAQLSLFDSYRYASGSSPIVQYSPVFSPTRTPLPSPTPIISTAKAVVTVYMDMNGNGTPEPNEGLSGIPVQIKFPDGRILSATTVAGQATIDLSGTVTGTQLIATLPNLFRSYQFFLPQSGIVPITFSFAQPTLPGKLP